MDTGVGTVRRKSCDHAWVAILNANSTTGYSGVNCMRCGLFKEGEMLGREQAGKDRAESFRERAKAFRMKAEKEAAEFLKNCNHRYVREIQSESGQFWECVDCGAWMNQEKAMDAGSVVKLDTVKPLPVKQDVGSFNKRMYWWKLEGEIPVPCSAQEADDLLKDGARRRVALTNVSGVVVSTIFTVLDLAMGEGVPLIYETLVSGRLGEWTQRYNTLEQAKRGHNSQVRKVRGLVKAEEMKKNAVPTPGISMADLGKWMPMTEVKVVASTQPAGKKPAAVQQQALPVRKPRRIEFEK